MTQIFFLLVEFTNEKTTYETKVPYKIYKNKYSIL